MILKISQSNTQLSEPFGELLQQHQLLAWVQVVEPEAGVEPTVVEECAEVEVSKPSHNQLAVHAVTDAPVARDQV